MCGSEVDAFQPGTLVKHIVDLHGGYIRLESELNKGSKFTIGLPDISEEITSENIE